MRAAIRVEEGGLFMKPCGCQVLLAPGGRQVLTELRCEAEGGKRLNLADLVEIPDEDFPCPPII